MQIKRDEHQSITFLKPLYSSCNGGFIHVLLIDRAGIPVNKFVSIENIDSIPTTLRNHIGYNVFFGVGTRRERDSTKEGIIEIPALWVDIDLTDKNGVDLPEKKEILQRLKDFPLKPSFLINSGGGIHAYFKLKSPLSKNEIPLAENLLKRLAFYLGDRSSTDASHNLRIPGTFNIKPKYKEKRRVTIEGFNPENEYDPGDFDFLPQDEEPYHEDQRQYAKETNERLNQIMVCEFLKHCDRDRATLSEPEWYAMISILAREPGGKDFIHSLSRGYPKYSPQETDKKILHAINDAGPTTCERIKILWNCGKDCGITSPVALARSRQDGTEDFSHPKSEKKTNTQVITYHLTTLNDVFEYPEPTYLIDPILIERTVNVLGAYTGVGKSIISLSIIKSILTGDPLWGEYSVLKKGPVLLVDEETPQGFLRERIEKMGFNKGLPIYFLHFQDVRLDRDDCFNALMERIDEVKPVLVVIDSLIRVHRQKEDDAMSMSLVVARLRKIANSGTTVLVIHHHKKGEGPLSQKLRGSSDIPGGVDVEFAIIPRDDYLIFSSVKTRTKPLTPIRLKMEVTEEKIEVVYQRVEIGERGELLHEVINILDGGERGFKEVREMIREEGFEVGERTLRDILRNATGKELLERTADRGKKFYRLNPVWQIGNPIYTCKTAKLGGNEGFRLAKNEEKLRDACQGQDIDNQGPDASLADWQKGIYQGDKLNLLEGEL